MKSLHLKSHHRMLPISLGLLLGLFQIVPLTLYGQTPEAPFLEDYRKLQDAFIALLDFSIPFSSSASVTSSGISAVSVTSGNLVSPTTSVNPATPHNLEDAQKPRNGTYTLADLEAMALVSSPLIQSAQASRKAAEADIQSAKAQRLPSLALDTSATYLGNPLGPIVVQKSDLGAFPNPQDPNGSTILVPPLDTTIYKGMEAALYQFKLSLDLPLFTWGKLNTGIEAAVSAFNAARMREAKAAHELRYRLRGTWEALAYVIRTEAVLDLQNLVCQRLVALARESYRSGFITRSELLSTEIKVKELEVGKAMAIEQQNRLLSELAYLTGISDLSLQNLVMEALPAGCTRHTLEEAIVQIPQKNYDLSAGRALLDAQKKLQQLADLQARGLPDVGLHLELTYGGPRFPVFETDWYGKDDYQFTLSLGTKGNILSNPVKKGEAQKVKAQTQDAQAQLAQGERNLGSFIREQYLTMELQKSRLEYTQLKLSSLQEEQERQKQLLVSGSGTETDYLAKLMESLSLLSDGYAQLATYRSTLIALEAAGSD